MKQEQHQASINHEAIEAAAAAWLARKDNADQWTDADEKALQDWISRSSAHAVAWLRLTAAWQIADDIGRVEARSAAQVPPAQRPTPVPRYRSRLIAGAFATVLAVVGVGLVTTSSRHERKEETFITAVGARQEVTLADGSRVTLNTRTRARAQVTATERRFWLESGEAFFEIQPDPKHPFVIEAGSDRITVLGTKFSVRHENNRTQVTVLEGRVRIDRARGDRASAPSAATVLAKNDAAVSQSDSLLVATKTNVQTQRDLSWREGRLDFENMPLSDIAAEFNRYNRRQLVVGADAASVRMTVRFDAHNIDGFVRLIETGFEVHSREEGDEIHLFKN